MAGTMAGGRSCREARPAWQPGACEGKHTLGRRILRMSVCHQRRFGLLWESSSSSMVSIISPLRIVLLYLFGRTLDRLFAERSVAPHPVGKRGLSGCPSYRPSPSVGGIWVRYSECLPRSDAHQELGHRQLFFRIRLATALPPGHGWAAGRQLAVGLGCHAGRHEGAAFRRDCPTHGGQTHLQALFPESTRGARINIKHPPK